MRAALDSTLETTMVMTSSAGGILQNSEDAKEARRAFMEKRKGQFKGIPDYALSSAIKAWYKTGTYGCFCGFERWRATRCNFKRGSARPSLLFFTEQRISAGRR
jgi:hypothetical protein